MRKVIVFLVVAGLWVTCAHAEDVIYLKSGEVLQGQILAQDTTNEMIQFRFQDGREFLIRTSDIQNMMSQSNPLGQQPQNYAQQPYFAPPPNYSPNPYYPFQGYGMPQGQSAPPGFGQTAPPYYGQFAPQYFGNAPQGRQTRGVSSVGRESQNTAYKTTKKSPSSSKWGLKAGANFASVSLGAGSVTPVSSRTGVALGIINDFSLTSSFSIQSELAYSQYGSSSSGLTLSYNTIEAQVLGKYGFLERKSFVRPFAMAGFAPAFRISSRVSGEGVDNDASSLSDTFLISGVIGGSVLFGSRDKTNIGLDIRYMFGLNNVSTTEVSAKNSTFYFGTTFLF